MADAEKGTLADDVLVENISQAISQVMGEPDKTIETFIVHQPVVKNKKTAWREYWIFDSEGSNEPFIITFRKDKKGFTDFAIQLAQKSETDSPELNN